MRSYAWMGFLGIAVLLAAAAPARAGDAVRAKLAIHSLQQRGGLKVDANSLDGLAAYLGAKLGERKSLSILQASLVKTRYAKNAPDNDPECRERSCQMQTEMALDADYGLVVSLMGIGKKCVLTAALYPRAGSATLRTASAQGGCELEAMSGSVDKLVDKLLQDGELKPLARKRPQAPVTRPPRAEVPVAPPPSLPPPAAPPAAPPPEAKAPVAPAPSRVMIDDGWPNFDLSVALLYLPAPMIRYKQERYREDLELQDKLLDQMGMRTAFEWRLFGWMLIGGELRLLGNERNILVETGPKLGAIFTLGPKFALTVSGTAGISFWSMRDDNFFCEDVQFYGGVFAQLALGMRYQISDWLALEADLAAIAGAYGSGDNPNDFEPYTCDPPEALSLWRLQAGLGLVFGL